MAKAKKLPSGQWRTLVYDYTDSDGKRHYESFTAATKKESEFLAADFSFTKKSRSKIVDMKLSEAITEYINTSDAVLSPTTINGYRVICQNAFQDIMDIPLKKITNALLRDAVNNECKRKSTSKRGYGKTISPKTVCNEYGLITAVLNKYIPSLDCTVKLPQKEKHFNELVAPEIIFSLVKDTEIELPVLLAMWLSFSISEIKGLTKTHSVINGYIVINEVVVNVDGKEIRKKQGKQITRNRKHKIPEYIMSLIDKVETDELVPMSSKAVAHRFTRILEKNNMPHMTFHDLRHVNASVMALLRIPDKYAMERGGWKTDKVMKDVYMQTFSDERVAVDNMIDNYFISKMQHEMQHEKQKPR